MTLSSVRRDFSRWLFASTFIALLACVAVLPLKAQSTGHIVSNHALQQRMQANSATRQKNMATVKKFFSTPLAQRAMKMEHVSPSQVTKAIPTLSNSELANLSARANQAQQQFAAGVLSTSQMLLLIIVLLIVVLLVAVH